MARSRFVHPALQQQHIVDAVKMKDEEDLAQIDGWDGFSPLKKKILLCMPYFSDELQAYQYVKNDPEASKQAFYALRKGDEKFKRAIAQRRGARVDLCRTLGVSMMGKALHVLDRFLDGEIGNAKTQFEAVKCVLGLEGTREDTALNRMANYGDMTVNIMQTVEQTGETIKHRIATGGPILEADWEELDEE